MKCRIIKRTYCNNINYIIQQKHFLFRWWWVNAWINSTAGADCTDSFYSLQEAQNNLCYFSGSNIKEEIILEELT